MVENRNEPGGPDLALGIALADLPDGGKLVGHVGDEQVLLVRRGSEVFAVSALCTHYHGPLFDGLVVDDTIRCPWHHASFDLRTGEALRAPAFSPLACWSVEERAGRIYVGERRARSEQRLRDPISGKVPGKIVIVGAGAAGFAAAERLRRERFQGDIVMLSDDDTPPIDRPNLSKDYLAGSAPENWLPLRAAGYYSKNGIDLRLNVHVNRIEPRSSEVMLADRTRIPLRARNIEVHVVAADKRPMERILGPQMGDFIRGLHEQNGGIFHLETVASAIEGKQVKLKGGGMPEADLVVAGIGVRLRIEIAEAAGLAVDRGVVVDSYLETSEPGVFAAGDIARWPDPYSGEMLRVEHWVVAERQGQIAALNMMGHREKFNAVPFFWSQHYDTMINYVGHAENWDELAIEGEIASRDCVLRFKNKGRGVAVASIFRDMDSLKAELAMERVGTVGAWPGEGGEA